MCFAQSGMEGHICRGPRGGRRKHERRDFCSFCAAIRVSPEKRSGTMKTVIEVEQLQLEIKELLKSDGTKENHESEENETKVKSSC